MFYLEFVFLFTIIVSETLFFKKIISGFGTPSSSYHLTAL